MKLALSIALSVLVAPASAVSQWGSPSLDPAPGYNAILEANYDVSEREINASQADNHDAAKLINLGIVYGLTNRSAEAEKLFRQVVQNEDVTILVANGDTVSAHEVASKALARLRAGTLGR